jgi:uncharacterized protein involved in exopolysaccharide biosynthesis
MPQSESQLPLSDAEDALDLLDLLVVVAENIKLLILGPLLIGLLAWGSTFILPPRYESESWLQLDDNIAEASVAYFTSADVLVPLLAQTPWISERESGPKDALEKLRNDIHASYSKADRLVKVRVQASTPEQARLLNAALVEAFRVFNLPKGKELEQLEQQAELVRASLKELGIVQERLGQNMDKVSLGTAGDNVARAYIYLSEQRMLREKTLQELNRKLTGFGDEVFAQSPGLPTKPTKPHKGFIAVTAGLISGLALLLFVFFRHGWRQAALHEESARKIQRIRKSLGARNL